MGRPDGTLAKVGDSNYFLFPHVLKKRYDAQNMITVDIPVEPMKQYINEKRKGKTTIIIASRVSTVSHLDKILVLKEGRVEAFDTPKRLLEISPTYQKMVYLQQLENEL